MRNPYGEEPGLNRFLLVSLVLHAILFFTLPNLGSLLEADVPGMAGGSAIQVMHVETSVNPRSSPETDRLSQANVPRVTEPRPEPEAPPEEQPVAEPEEPEVEEVQVEQASPAVPEEVTTPQEPVLPEPEPTIPDQSVDDLPEELGSGEVLTSPTGPEVVVEPPAREVVVPPVESRPDPEQAPIPPHSSGSGEATEGSSDEPGVTESGEGEAQTVPPPPPPPASGSGLHGGGAPTYPKNAEHDGVEGVVFIRIEVNASGELQRVALERSSGDERLDFQAVRYIEGIWSFESQPYDYSMDVAVVFSREDNRFISNVEYGEVDWLNAPQRGVE